MSFSWTLPDPLVATTGLAIFFTEIQDAVDSLRQDINQPAYNLWYIAQAGITEIKEVHYTQLQTVINTLIQDYGYNIVVDILGRDWSDYYVLKYGYNSASFQLLQDFRDVLDVLKIKMEQWILTINYIPFPSVEYEIGWGYGVYPDGWWSEGADKIVSVKGDIGLWTLTSINGQSHHTITKKWGYPADGGDVIYNVSYLPKDSPNAKLAIDVIGYYEDQKIVTSVGGFWYWKLQDDEYIWVYSGDYDRGVSMSNESYMAEFKMEGGEVPDDWGNFYGEFDREIYLTSNSKFKIDMSLSGTPASVYNSAHDKTLTTPLLLSMRLFFHKFAKDPALQGGQEIIDIVFTNQTGYDITSIWKKYSYGSFNSNIAFSELPFKTYWSGASQIFDLENYNYKWVGIKIVHQKSHQQMGSYEESVPSGSSQQSGNTPNFSLIINKIGVIEIV